MSVRGIKVEFSKLMNYLSKPGDKTILFQTQMHAPKYKHKNPERLLFAYHAC